jgi:hypothetical protein
VSALDSSLILIIFALAMAGFLGDGAAKPQVARNVAMGGEKSRKSGAQ